MVQNFSPFLLINKSGGNRISFHLDSMFIKEVNAVKWRLEIFCKISCKISLSTVFTHLAQACQVAKWQDGAWSKEGYVIPGIKVHELKAQLFPLPMLFVLCLFSFPFPCLHPVPKDRSRQCFCCPPDTCLGLLGLAATPPAHLPISVLLSSCCWGGGRRGAPAAEAQLTTGSAWLPGRAGPGGADVQVALPHAELFQGQHQGAFWVGSDAESCRIIRDEQLTLINTYYCQTSHKPHKSLWRFIAALMTLFYHGEMNESGWIYQRQSLNKA